MRLVTVNKESKRKDCRKKTFSESGNQRKLVCSSSETRAIVDQNHTYMENKTFHIRHSYFPRAKLDPPRQAPQEMKQVNEQTALDWLSQVGGKPRAVSHAASWESWEPGSCPSGPK